MAVGYYRLESPAMDPEAVCVLFEAETNISECTAVGGVGEAEAAIIASEVLSAPNQIVFKVTGTAALDITTAAAALVAAEDDAGSGANVVVASGYPDPA